MHRLTGVLGIALLLGLALLLSADRRRVPWRLVGTGLAVQFLLAILLLRLDGVRDLFDLLASFVAALLQRANAGIDFVFGPELGTFDGPVGFVFAVRVLPVIIFFASLMSVLYHLGVMQRLIAALAWLLHRTLGVTAAEALAMAANVFVGQTEAPLAVRPLIAKMTEAQIMTLMVGGFATVAGSVLAAYLTLLAGGDASLAEEYAKHLIVASVLSAPAAFVVARVLQPETGQAPDERIERLQTLTRGDGSTNVLDAAATGATTGLRLALNVGAMLIAFVSLLALVDWPLAALSDWPPVADLRASLGVPPLDVRSLLGALLAPLAWSLGIPWEESGRVGAMLGTKLVATELVAYGDLARAIHPAEDSGEAPLSPRSTRIALYALCGFANFPSIAIQIGGLSAISPERRATFSRLALRAMLGGAFASWMTAAIAGIVT